jgi:hypothetical protein
MTDFTEYYANLYWVEDNKEYFMYQAGPWYSESIAKQMAAKYQKEELDFHVGAVIRSHITSIAPGD